jgi:hypothetical protein
MSFEVLELILNSPSGEPKWHCNIVEGETPKKRAGCRPAFYCDPKSKHTRRYSANTRSMPNRVAT